MSQFFSIIFTSKHTPELTSITRTKYGILAGVMGLIINLLLFGFKLFFGILSFSATIIADAINSLSDSISNFLVILGFKVSKRPPDKNHPYGYARFEYITSLIMAVIIFVLGVYMIYNSITKIISPSIESISIFTICFLFIAVLAKVFLWVSYTKLGKTLKSASLTTAGKDALNDTLSTSFVLIFCLLTYFFGSSIAFLDGVFGVVVSLIIILSGYNLIKKNSSSLLGSGASATEQKALKNALLDYDFILDVHNVQFHKYGHNKTFASAHICIDGSMPLIMCNNLINDVEEQIEKKFNLDITLHIDALDKTDKLTMHYRNKLSLLLSDIDALIEIDSIETQEYNSYIEIQCQIVLPAGSTLDIKELEASLLSKMQNHKKDIVLHLYT